MQSTLNKPRVHEVILLLESLFKEFRILHDYKEVIAVSPKPEVLTSIGKKHSNLREEAQDYLVDNGKAVPKPHSGERTIIQRNDGMPMTSRLFLLLINTKWKDS